MEITIEIDESFFNGLETRLSDFKTVFMNDVLPLIQKSINENFMQGGRPDKWKPSKRALLTGTKTLIDTTRLIKSVTGKDKSDEILVITPTTLKFGTSVPYGHVHQQGATIRAKTNKNLKFKVDDRWVSKKSVTIVARPFLMFQDEDITEINNILQDYIVNGTSNENTTD